MRLIYADLSMSLDGFIAGPNVSVDNPMGDRGVRLHDWMFAGRSADEIATFEEERFANTGALLMGRTMLDVGIGPWGDNPAYHAPVVVLTHRPAEPIVKSGGTTYTFVTDPSAALRRARDAAGSQEICIAGGEPSSSGTSGPASSASCGCTSCPFCSAAAYACSRAPTIGWSSWRQRETSMATVSLISCAEFGGKPRHCRGRCYFSRKPRGL